MLGPACRFEPSCSRYASEAVLPFYILHQPVILGIGFFVVQWNIGIIFKYVFIIVTSFAAIILVYDFLVRRFNAMRFFLGMKINQRATVGLKEAKSYE